MLTADAAARGRNPFELLMLTWAVLAGAGSLLSPPGPPPSLERALPGWVTLCWSAVLVAGGLTALTGVLWRTPSLGLLLERIGLWALAGAAAGYSMELFVTVGSRAYSAGLIVAAFGAAAAMRILQITRSIRDAARQDVER